MKRIYVCKKYKPKFGQGQKTGLSLQEFKDLYGSDSFYSWFGLDNHLMYAAHKAAGGITSVYRQIGIGCEEVFRLMFQDHLGLNENQVKWSYETTMRDGRKRKLSLDGCIQLTDIASIKQHRVVSKWLIEAANYLEIASEVANVLKGAVFEVRQGYKSKDSKRQNADIANAATAFSQGYLPVVAVFSEQIDNDIVERYENEKWLILRGHVGGSPLQSTYAFSKKIIGYDLAKFFQKNSAALKNAIEDVLKTLLKAK